MAEFLRCVHEKSCCCITGISGPLVVRVEEWPELIADVARFSVIVPDDRSIDLFAPLLRVSRGLTLPLPHVATAAIELAQCEA